MASRKRFWARSWSPCFSRSWGALEVSETKGVGGVCCWSEASETPANTAMTARHAKRRQKARDIRRGDIPSTPDSRYPNILDLFWRRFVPFFGRGSCTIFFLVLVVVLTPKHPAEKALLLLLLRRRLSTGLCSSPLSGDGAPLL